MCVVLQNFIPHARLWCPGWFKKKQVKKHKFGLGNFLNFPRTLLSYFTKPFWKNYSAFRNTYKYDFDDYSTKKNSSNVWSWCLAGFQKKWWKSHQWSFKFHLNIASLNVAEVVMITVPLKYISHVWLHHLGGFWKHLRLVHQFLKSYMEIYFFLQSPPGHKFLRIKSIFMRTVQKIFLRVWI